MAKLSADAAAALAAGMSYGKYMAMKYVPVQKQPEPEPVDQPKPRPKREPEQYNGKDRNRLCRICGAPFYAMVHNQVCCSSECSYENSLSLARERIRQIRGAKHGDNLL